jgi:hypothetical protein
VLASLIALALVLNGRRLWLVLDFGVAASALAAMLVSRYVDLGALGPFPDLYNPVWFPGKAVGCVWRRHRRSGRSHRNHRHQRPPPQLAHFAALPVEHGSCSTRINARESHKT